MTAPSLRSSTESGPGTAAIQMQILETLRSTFRSTEGLDFTLQDLSGSNFFTSSRKFGYSSRISLF